MSRVFEMFEDEYHEGVEDNLGICLACGETQDEFYEPDRTDGKCHDCGKLECVGFEWALVAGMIEFKEKDDGTECFEPSNSRGA